MTVILEDLSTLPPRKLARRLEELAAEALPCLEVTAHDASPEVGLTTGLWVDDRGRRDLHDLVRVVETEPGGYATVAWAGLSPSVQTPYWRLLLRVRFESPVHCAFDIQVATRTEDSDWLALMLAASRFAVVVDDGAAAVVVPAPKNSDLLWHVAAAIRTSP